MNFFRQFFAMLVSLTIFNATAIAEPAVATTYHYNNARTGWNPNETQLSAVNFPNDFRILSTVALDGKVDAQPLFLPGSLTGVDHDTVYVATENNTVYAINAGNGQILLKHHLGPPVLFPLGCSDTGATVGILSTPVID